MIVTLSSIGQNVQLLTSNSDVSMWVRIINTFLWCKWSSLPFVKLIAAWAGVQSLGWGRYDYIVKICWIWLLYIRTYLRATKPGEIHCLLMWGQVNTATYWKCIKSWKVVSTPSHIASEVYESVHLNSEGYRGWGSNMAL